MELKIQKVFSDIKASGEFYESEFEKVQNIIGHAHKILDIMENNFSNTHCEVLIRKNEAVVQALSGVRLSDIEFRLEINKDYIRCYQEDKKSQEIADKLEPYILEIYKNI